MPYNSHGLALAYPSRFEDRNLLRPSRILTLTLVVVLVVSGFNIAEAEWIFPITNPGVKVDSIYRYLVVRDTTMQKVFGAQILSLGDISGDGCTDVLICRNEGNNLIPNNAYLFYGGTTLDSVFDAEFLNFKSNMNKIGDVTGDGFMDFGMYLPEPSYQFFWGGHTFDDNFDFRIPSILSFTCRSGDIDSDGGLDIALSTDPNGGYVNIYRIDFLRDTLPEYVIPDTSTSFGNNIAVGDFNGDTYPDLAVSSNLDVHLDSSRIKFYWGGPDFDTIPDFVISRAIWGFGKIMMPIDDFNGDGYGDLFIGGA
ncbi:MAG: FG-GAP repeat protein, partial [Candidatus Zixiibacteriota bacterium]